jgi:ABC-2 type transport system ATP-binding protein/lipopolysaccharide transport system ATP-binding protein
MRMDNEKERHKMVEVRDVSMRFRLTDDKIMSLKEFVTRKLSGKLKVNEFWALKHVSFDVYKGEVLGIIGHNGAGKSTVLKAISGILKPTNGSIITRGNIVPMLELGSGFDFDLTGKENIFLNGAILGYNEEFLKSKYNEIEEFSELGQFIDVPIRNYSSGMLARLAFSIATVVNPEILIVDEILSVGDVAFQEKSRKRMMELMGGGTTVLFVSHSLQQIREMCDRTVWLEHGEVQAIGTTVEICDQYEQTYL